MSNLLDSITSPADVTGLFLSTGELPGPLDQALAALRPCYDALPADADRAKWLQLLRDFRQATSEDGRARARAALVRLREKLTP